MDDTKYHLHTSVLQHNCTVHINCGVRRYGSSKNSHRAVHFFKHVVGANFTLHVIAGLHGKMYYEVTLGPSTSMTFINFIYNTSNVILHDGHALMACDMHVILDNAAIHKTYADNVVRHHLSQLNVGYHFLPRLVIFLHPFLYMFNFPSNRPPYVLNITHYTFV